MFTQYKFQKYLALALFDPEGWEPHSKNWRTTVTKKERGISYTNEFQAVARGAVKRPTAERIIADIFDPVIGKFCDIIVYGELEFLRYLPVQCKLKEPICLLHRYAHERGNSERKFRTQCMWCDDCQVDCASNTFIRSIVSRSLSN